MTNDPVNYVRQGALIASALIMIQQTEITCPKVTWHTLHSGVVGEEWSWMPNVSRLARERGRLGKSQSWMPCRKLLCGSALCNEGAMDADRNTPGRRQHFNSSCSFLKGLKASCNDMEVTVFHRHTLMPVCTDFCEHLFSK